MTLTRLLWGLVCVFAISGGQILFKLASRTMVPLNGLGSLWHILSNTYLMIGLVVYAVTTFLWIGLLRVVPLKHAYPLMALAFIIVPLSARLFLNEKLEVRSIVGGFIILAGVYVSVR